MGTFRHTIEIGDPQGSRYETLEALVDTGATYSVVAAPVLRRLGVEVHNKRTFELADGRQVERDVGQTWMRVDGEAVITLVVFGDESAEPLLGAVTLEQLLLAVDPVRGRLIPVSGLLMQTKRT